jgi:hypothetical protein
MATVAVVAGGSPVVAKPRPAHVAYGRAPDHLVLTVFSDEAGWARVIKLTCDPPGGKHPDPAGACAALMRTGADPDKLAPAALLCMMIYLPVTAEITGTWHGAAVKWSHPYGNECEMKRATGVLFKF